VHLASAANNRHIGGHGTIDQRAAAIDKRALAID
jgi:hypothetical protein